MAASPTPAPRSRRRALAVGALALAGLVAWLVGAPEDTPEPAAEPVASAAPAPPPTPLEPNAPRADDVGTASASRALFGVVRDDAGRALAGVTARVVPEGGGEARVVRTTDDGAYVLLDVPAKPLRLEFTAAGFVPQVFDGPQLPRERRARWDVVLVPARGVYGRVTSGGQPVAMAFVALGPGDGDMPDDAQHGRARRRRRLGTTRTDGDGRFALDWPSEATPPFRVFAAHAQYGEVVADVERPGAVDLELPGGGFVEGRVVDARTKRPVPSFMVSASMLEWGGTGMMAVDDEQGTFRLGPIAEGDNRVYVVASGYRPARSERFAITPGQTITGVELALERSAELRGRVTDARTGAPIVGATVEPTDWDADSLAESVGATTDASGRYVLSSLPGRRTSIRARAEGYRGLVHGGVDGRAARASTLDFALTPDGDGDGPKNELTGIGAQLRMTELGALVSGVVDGGPAAKTLKAGDVIVMVDALETKSSEFEDVVQAIRGEAGSKVTLWVLRGGAGTPERVSLERSRVSWR
jgi:hypothetical protein